MDMAGPYDSMMHVDGQSVGAVSGGTVDVFDPSTGASLGGSERQRILWRASDLSEAEAAHLAELEARNNGMLLPAAHAMVGLAVETLRYHAGWATKVHGIATDLSRPDGTYHAYTTREPVGVAATIVPWNVPIPLTIVDPAMPGGDFKQSGWGQESGQVWLDAYLQTKSVFAAL